MDLDTNTASALVWAVGVAREHGGATAALLASGIELPPTERLEGVSVDFGALFGRPPGDATVREAFALGVLAGRVAHRRPRTRRLQDPTSSVLDTDLVVQAVEGESILRLPWVDDGLCVGRPLPAISEMPAPLRRTCMRYCTAALAGERGRFTFTSYGHTFSVDVVPVRSGEQGTNGSVDGVLAIATPAPAFTSAATAYLRTAERLDHGAALAESRADSHRAAGDRTAELADRNAAEKARQAAERARAIAGRLHSNPAADPPSVTARETEVLALASLGLSSADIAEQLIVSTATIKTHFENIYPKLGVSDRAAAVAAALRYGLIE